MARRGREGESLCERVSQRHVGANQVRRARKRERGGGSVLHRLAPMLWTCTVLGWTRQSERENGMEVRREERVEGGGMLQSQSVCGRREDDRTSAAFNPQLSVQV
eukprot:6185466-Pleurochrysis_carterae.AAC.1